MLTAEQQRARALITASAIPILMSGNTERINRYFCEAIGEKEPEDLSTNYSVQRGAYMESFNLDWHQARTGKQITKRGIVYRHPTIPYLSATIDGLREEDDCVIEAKDIGSWQRMDDAIGYYGWQVLCQMRCVPCERGALLISHGGAEPVEVPVLIGEDSEKEMFSRIHAFKLCVDLLTPPAPIPAVIPPEQWRTIILDGNPDWPNWAPELAFNLDQWRDARPAAMEYDRITNTIKGLLPDDVGRLDYAGMTIKRNRRGALTIKDMNE